MQLAQEIANDEAAHARRSPAHRGEYRQVAGPVAGVQLNVPADGLRLRLPASIDLSAMISARH